MWYNTLFFAFAATVHTDKFDVNDVRNVVNAKDLNVQNFHSFHTTKRSHNDTDVIAMKHFPNPRASLKMVTNHSYSNRSFSSTYNGEEQSADFAAAHVRECT